LNPSGWSAEFICTPFVYGKRKFHFIDILKKKKETHCDEDTIHGRAKHTAGGTAPPAEITPWSADF
jgi:hypothetical protein